MDFIKRIMNNSNFKFVSTIKTNKYTTPKNKELDDVIRQWVTKK
jgi:hypothetical protein